MRHPSAYRQLATVCCALVLLLAACGPGGESGTDDEAADVRAQLEQAQERIAELEGELEAAQEAAHDDDTEPTPPGDRGEPATPHTPEGLVEQLRTYFPAADLPEGWQPGTTSWVPADVPVGYGQADDPAFGTPGELATALAAEVAGPQLGSDVWEVTARVLASEGAEATAAVLVWGLADDAVAGSDLRLYLARNDTGWYVDSAEERFHCRRGVSGDLCV
ncbi:MAG TPA: hypothetical protein VM324_00675 [Egibacteraceae bacterium]|jgi:hypothetical protein|nr:hypothetical protein [Egibacteraceae bacterium]